MAFTHARNVDARYSTFNVVGGNQYNLHYGGDDYGDVGCKTLYY
jgi:hypothetical protein